MSTGLGMVRGMDQKWKDVPSMFFFWGGGVNFESIHYVPHVDYLRTRHKKAILLPTGLGMVR